MPWWSMSGFESTQVRAVAQPAAGRALRVAVVDAGGDRPQQAGVPGGEPRQALELVLGQRLGREQVERGRVRLGEQALEHRHVVAQALAARRPGHHHRVERAAQRLDGPDLVRVEPLDAARGQRLGQRSPAAAAPARRSGPRARAGPRGGRARRGSRAGAPVPRATRPAGRRTKAAPRGNGRDGVAWDDLAGRAQCGPCGDDGRARGRRWDRRGQYTRAPRAASTPPGAATRSRAGRRSMTSTSQPSGPRSKPTFHASLGPR